MLNSAFDEWGDASLDFYPERLRGEIDRVNALVYPAVNNGVYRAGFATTQQAYEEAFGELFAALDTLEERLGRQRYLAGDLITEADWRLFTTLARFDPVYVGHFKCNLRRIADYPNLSNYLRELYQVPGIAETVNMHHIKAHYYGSHETINPTRIVPVGPAIDYSAPHNRGRWRRRLRRSNALYVAASNRPLTNTPTLRPLENLGQPPPRCRRRVVRQPVKREEPGLGDLAVRQLRRAHLEIADEVKQHMVAPARLAVEMHRPQRGRRGQRDLAFLQQFPHQRLARRLADLDAAARQLPARHVGVADQHDRSGGAVVDERAHAERHRPADEEERMEQAGAQTGPTGLPKRRFRIGCARLPGRLR